MRSMPCNIWVNIWLNIRAAWEQKERKLICLLPAHSHVE